MTASAKAAVNFAGCYVDKYSKGIRVLTQDGCSGNELVQGWQYAVAGDVAKIEGHDVTGKFRQANESQTIDWSNEQIYDKVTVGQHIKYYSVEDAAYLYAIITKVETDGFEIDLYPGFKVAERVRVEKIQAIDGFPDGCFSGRQMTLSRIPIGLPKVSHPGSRKSQMLFHQVDTNGDGVISPQEFEAAIMAGILQVGCNGHKIVPIEGEEIRCLPSVGLVVDGKADACADGEIGDSIAIVTADLGIDAPDAKTLAASCLHKNFDDLGRLPNVSVKDREDSPITVVLHRGGAQFFDLEEEVVATEEVAKKIVEEIPKEAVGKEIEERTLVAEI